MSRWQLRTTSIELDHPVMVGVLNVTPDSFSDGGAHTDADAAVAHGHSLVEAGAEVIDVGGESTRPGADPVGIDEEAARVIPVVERLAAEGIVVSVDTMKAPVASAALAAGAEIVNDVGGFADPAMRAVAARSGAGIVIMHMQGTPRTMQVDPRYDDVVDDIGRFLAERARVCQAEGVDSDRICLDPGIGFGKTGDHNLELIDRLDELVALGYPVMVGASRKSFLGRLLDIPEPADRDAATAVVTALAVERGAMVFRIHDPASSKEAARLAWAIVGSRDSRPRYPIT